MNLIQHPYTAYLASAPCLDTYSTMKKKKKKKNGGKNKASTTRSRRSRSRSSSSSAKVRRNNNSSSSSSSAQEAAKKQKTHHDAATSYAALFAYLKTKHPSLSNAVFELTDEDALTMKFVNRDSGDCPNEGWLP